MTTWVALAIGAGIVLLGALLVHAYKSPWSWKPSSALTIGGGLAITLIAIASIGLFAGVRTTAAPEQQGIGIVVDGVVGSPKRGGDVGLFAALHVDVVGCGKPVEARLTVIPSAEFWIDNQALLAEEATIRLGLPIGGISDVRAYEGDESTAPLPSAQGIDAEQTPVDDVQVTTSDRLTTVVVTVQDWSRDLHPISVHFDAEWTRPRSLLGGCYLELPALTGFPTVLTAARMLGTAVPLAVEPAGRRSVFVVASELLGVHAYYDPFHEVTSGVTTIGLTGHTVDEGLSAPAPTGSLYGAPSWRCRSDIVDDVDFLQETTKRFEDPPEYLVGQAVDSSGAFSIDGIGTALDQSSCGAFVLLAESGSGTKRDAVLIFAGALFSLGIEVVFNGLKRRRQAGAVSATST
jgi:hypothetical protein